MTRSDIILVDHTDRATGTMEKVAAHLGDGHLHRAFSVFAVRRDGRIILQQRAAQKMLWPLYWSNTCCSHPRPGEAVADAAKRRLADEMGLVADCTALYSFEYKARYKSVGTEHERCHVLICHCDATPDPDPTEVHDWVCLDRTGVSHLIASRPDEVTPWFVLEWQHLLRHFPDFDRPIRAKATADMGASPC